MSNKIKLHPEVIKFLNDNATTVVTGPRERYLMIPQYFKDCNDDYTILEVVNESDDEYLRIKEMFEENWDK